jgi:flagellar hook-associated protein 1
MSGMLNIGLTGLNASQAQLTTTSHNITNAAVQGYNRQRAIQTSTHPFLTGAGFFGQGTQIDAVTRQYSKFVENQMLSASNRQSEFSTYHEQIRQINNLLADQSSGLSPALHDFFKGVQEVASNPSSIPGRQAMISTAESLVARFQNLDQRLTEVRQGVEGELEAYAIKISSYAEQIAETNAAIIRAQKGGPQIPANDLLDQRNRLVAELNEVIKVNAIEQNDGQFAVFIGSGQALVMGQNYNTMQAIRGQNDPQRFDLQLTDFNGNQSRLPENVLTGGALGGLLDFRRVTLDDAQNRLGLVALGLVQSFNAQHRLGVDLDGKLGGDFFRAQTPNVIPSGGVEATIEDVSALAPSDYLLRDVGGTFELIRLSDNQRTTLAGFPQTIDGMRIDNPTAPFPENGVLIQPTRYLARDIAVAVRDPRQVAAGGPVVVDVPLNNGGNARVEGLMTRNVDGLDGDADGFPDFAPFQVQFNANAFSLPAGMTIERYNTATQAWDAVNAYDPATDAAGVRFRITAPLPAGFELEFELSGSPINNDVFRFAPGSQGIADSRNAVALGALQTTKLLFSTASGARSATFQSTYSQLVTSVGNKTREVQVGEESQAGLLRQASEAREALSGVNLDEEAANLIRYQQTYQASAQVMNVSQRLFDELIGVVR